MPQLSLRLPIIISNQGWKYLHLHYRGKQLGWKEPDLLDHFHGGSLL